MEFFKEWHKENQGCNRFGFILITSPCLFKQVRYSPPKTKEDMIYVNTLCSSQFKELKKLPFKFTYMYESDIIIPKTPTICCCGILADLSSVSDPDTGGSLFKWPPGSGPVFDIRIRIRSYQKSTIYANFSCFSSYLNKVYHRNIPCTIKYLPTFLVEKQISHQIF